MSEGLINQRVLPDAEFNELWKRIFLADNLKKRLLNQIVFEMTTRSNFRPGEVPMHGVILLVGPPGTGKTSLAKGVASKAAQLLKGQKVRYLEVEPHSLISSSLGKSQKMVKDLLHEQVAAEASKGPLIVLLDEVETLAANRSRMSLDSNPIDVHRATDAVLAGLDMLASKYPKLLFIATSNFAKAVDDAFLSRADLILEIGNPSADARAEIIQDSLQILATKWPKIESLITKANINKLAEASEGFDARRIRKSILAACTLDVETALDPNQLQLKDLKHVFESERLEDK